MTAENNVWLTPPERPRLHGGEVHVWRVSLARGEGRAARCETLLSEEEKGRAARYRFAKDRESFVVARGALRHVLGAYLGRAPSEVAFRLGPYGKPFLAEPHGGGELRFNLSHSGEVALVALALGREVGVDVELMREDFSTAEIASSFFSPREVEALFALAPDCRTQGFYNCWTRKEAYIKARGEGLSHPLHDFSVSLAPGEDARLVAAKDGPGEVARWSFFALEPGAGYAGALAVEGAPSAVRGWRWVGL